MIIELLIIAILVSISCALSGVFLVARKMSMMADSITHTVLLGIVIAFFITKDLSSPFLIIGASFMGVFTVWLTEIIVNTKIVSKDASIGIVFPFLFSIAVILITKFASSIHLDTDSVLLGEIVFAPFDRLIINQIDFGARLIYTSFVIFLINILIITLFFKEFIISTFDPILAKTQGISPVFMHYLLMTMVSITAVGSFEAVGSVLVIAFMIVPVNTAYLISDNLKNIVFSSCFFATASALLGFFLANTFDVSIAGSMAVISGIFFLMVFIFSEKNGLLIRKIQKNKLKKEFYKLSLLFYIQNEPKTLNLEIENSDYKKSLNRALKSLKKDGDILMRNNKIYLTEKGTKLLENYIENIKLKN